MIAFWRHTGGGDNTVHNLVPAYFDDVVELGATMFAELLGGDPGPEQRVRVTLVNKQPRQGELEV